MINLYISKHADSRIGELCPTCQSKQATTRCRDCDFLEPLCTDCFLNVHKHTPFHFAEVWDSNLGFFQRTTMAGLKNDYALHIGHGGDPCPNNAKDGLFFTVVDTNGIHATRIKFCLCKGPSPDKWTQLFESNLFPASLKDPQTAFTFRVLRNYHIHSEASKLNAMDFHRALVQLTDNGFAENVPRQYDNFLLVTRIWGFLKTYLWAGQAHNLDRWFNRPAGNLLEHCPTCPELQVNLEQRWENTPEELRHLHARRLTGDGNHQANHFAKNSDSNDVSIFNGQSLFPRRDIEVNYLTTTPQLQNETKIECEHIKAINRQNSKKFKGMDITGIVNIQCDHVMVWSSVDMQLGERFANIDLALSRALDQRPFDVNAIPHTTFSYDAQCSYSVNQLVRFRKWLPKYAPYIRDMRFIIPSMHVRNHLDLCMYLFSSAYKPHVGHFHGETAEHVWPELNQLGPQIRQMTNGNRQDRLILIMLAWNYRKRLNMPGQLAQDLTTAIKTYLTARDNLLQLYDIHKNEVEEWNKMDRSPCIEKKRRVVTSVYTLTSKNVLSWNSLIRRMVASKEKIICGTRTIDMSTIGTCLREAFRIQETQRLLLMKRKSKEFNVTEDLERQRKQLTARISQWRLQQAKIMPLVGDMVLEQHPDFPEDEILFLPSDVSDLNTRISLELTQLATEEAKLRKAAAVDCVLNLRRIEKYLSTIRDLQAKDNQGQDQNTKANTTIITYENTRQAQIEEYGKHRCALRALGMLEEQEFPSLTIEDTYRKSTGSKRSLMDAHCNEGKLWTLGARMPANEDVLSPGSQLATTAIPNATATQMPRRQGPTKRNANSESVDDQGKGKSKEQRIASSNGWIWDTLPMSYDGKDEWELDHDRVQFFRAEAEFERWREQLEIKHAELERCIRGFGYTQNVWTCASQDVMHSPTAGHVAYAKRRAAVEGQLQTRSQTGLIKHGLPALCNQSSVEQISIGERVLAWRANENARFPVLDSVRPPFKDPTVGSGVQELEEWEDVEMTTEAREEAENLIQL
ncbi:hypothetical protein EV361DRAFT_595678 [Lentinula raphanica]|nr:hypothetical protein EV361DRAFT_595678 [Lentinula raphanica]